MVEAVAVGRVDNQLIAAAAPDSGFEVVTDHPARRPLQELKALDVALHPVTCCLGGDGVHKGVVGVAEHRDEDLCEPRGAACRVPDLHGPTSNVHEQRVTGPVYSSHDNVKILSPGPISDRELGVGHPLGACFPPLAPQLLHGRIGALHFRVHPLPVGQRFPLRNGAVVRAQGVSPLIVVKRRYR